MIDSNNVVIKIKYQGIKRNLNDSAQQENVTEWHIQRILTAVFLVTLIIILSFILIPNAIFEQELNGSKVVNKSKNDIIREVKDISNIVKKDKPFKWIKQQVKNARSNGFTIHDEKNAFEINTTPELTVDKRIVRTLLTTELVNKEPVDKITSPVTVDKIGATKLYYFTEIIDMKGQFLYHQWFLNDKVVFKRKIYIFANRWRASTSKLIHYSKSGLWKVRLINNEGNILNEIQFKIIKA